MKGFSHNGRPGKMYQGHAVTQVNEMAQGPLYLNPFLAPICKVFIK